jgi:hypothetical protein
MSSSSVASSKSSSYSISSSTATIAAAADVEDAETISVDELLLILWRRQTADLAPTPVSMGSMKASEVEAVRCIIWYQR